MKTVTRMIFYFYAACTFSVAAVLFIYGDVISPWFLAKGLFLSFLFFGPLEYEFYLERKREFTLTKMAAVYWEKQFKLVLEYLNEHGIQGLDLYKEFLQSQVFNHPCHTPTKEELKNETIH